VFFPKAKTLMGKLCSFCNWLESCSNEAAMAAVTIDFVRKMMLKAANVFVINPFATLLCKHGHVAGARKIEQLIKLPSDNTLSPVSVVGFSHKNGNLGLTNTQIARGT
jgi:hypothetical protein